MNTTTCASSGGTLVGTGYDTADPSVISSSSTIANSANSNWSTWTSRPPGRSSGAIWRARPVSIHINDNYNRLRAMAIAYATPGCSLEGNAALLADIDRRARLDECQSLQRDQVDLQQLVGLRNRLAAPSHGHRGAALRPTHPTQITNYMNAVDHQTPTPDMTPSPANRMWKIRVVGVRGCVVKNSGETCCRARCLQRSFRMSRAVTVFTRTAHSSSTTATPTLPVMAQASGAPWCRCMLLSGSTWAVTDPAQSNISQWVYDSFEPIIYSGAALDLVRGREAGAPAIPRRAVTPSWIPSCRSPSSRHLPMPRA